VKPAKFDYHAPATLDAAVALLEEYKGEARLLAGGQSLLPMMNFRLVTPAALVDLNRIAELAYIRAENGALRIGAMTRHRTVEFSPVVAERLPLLTETIRLVAHLPIRSRGTIGGSLALADPAAELPMLMQALEGEVVVRGPNGERVVPAADLVEGIMTTSLAADEILSEVCLPMPSPQAGFAVEEFSRRRGDFAVAAVTAIIERANGRCRKARLATAGVGAKSVRLTAAEAVLEGGDLDDETIEEAATRAAEEVSPQTDQHGTADYRRHLIRVLTARALRRACKTQ
jgi:aerobic carbon-monoxide dehydrogenase medium subunit